MHQHTLFDEPKSIDERYEECAARCPHMEKEFDRRAWEAVKNGATRLSARDIVSDMRRDPTFQVDGERFKVSDHYTCLLSRGCAKRHPQLAALFDFRKRTSQALETR